MSKSNRQRRAAKHRQHRRGPDTTHHESAEPDLLDDVRAALADPDPLHLLSFVSSLLTAIDPRSNRAPFARPDEATDLPTREELAAMFIDVDTPETTALLAAIGALSGDDVLRARIRRVLATRPDTGPDWLIRLADTSAYRAVRMGHVLGDGDNIMLGVRLAGTYELTFIVYVDHNLGRLVKDAYVVPESIADMIAEYRSIADEPEMVWEELSLADARAWLDDAIETAAITVPPMETESWPACRPLIEWITRGLAEGGSGYQRPQWDSGELSTLTSRFFASRWGCELDDADHRDLLESLLWYGTDYGPGDPLRWSAVQVEILLVDWLPRKVVAPATYLAKAPELLRAFVRFAHAEVGLRTELTDETLAAIDACAPHYQTVIRSPRPQGPEALLDALGVGADGFALSGFDEPYSFEESMLDYLAHDVGGHEQLDHLDAAPLADEPFQWSGIADDVTARVAEVLALTDGCCDELLDVEYRTVSRRLLARVASGDPAVFRRKARVETAAAAVVWIAGKANGLFESLPGRRLQVSDLTAYFGIGQSSVSGRAATMLRAGGFRDDTYAVRLGSPDYLIADRRQWLIGQRDRFQQLTDSGD
ncbi:DUF6398 domain-containing protein [Mycobacterium sp. 141]|uniref:DUF6398 domain-containing protein n=1 Tax=Mycobacterium sp. 141 TaxID=1120797 RepID=UPI00039C4C6D|nr:DUF6398 domain-containing protein [Mycobacterium sp. 141]